jgi:hypothetical protein
MRNARLEWPSNDPVDRAWYIFRKASEEASNRYGITLAGSVVHTGLMSLVRLTLFDYKIYKEFYFQKHHRGPWPEPNHYFKSQVEPALRELAEARDKK